MSFIDESPWADTVCHSIVPLYTARIVTAHPAKTVTEQTCWLDNVEAVARYRIARLECEQQTVIAGIVVERTSAHARLKYRVAGGSACGLREAVQAVCEAVAGTNKEQI